MLLSHIHYFDGRDSWAPQRNLTPRYRDIFNSECIIFLIARVQSYDNLFMNTHLLEMLHLYLFFMMVIVTFAGACFISLSLYSLVIISANALFILLAVSLFITTLFFR